MRKAKKQKTSLKENTVTAEAKKMKKVIAERKKLMEEASRLLKGRKPLTKKELADDPYINYKLNE